jgi:uncharacterized protein YjbJ (UPF0337 family)
VNKEIMQDRWSQMRAEAQQRWNKLTDEDFENVTGQVDKLAETVGERYGYSREQAQKEVDHFMRKYGDNIQGTTTRWFGKLGDFLADNPWAAALAGLLVFGLIVSRISRLKNT